jgi:saccharopine dehydrogenase-like NADP-dependent oxidoreductase
MKKIAIFGVGAQGSTIARRMDEHPNVSGIVCADYDSRAAEELSNSLNKASALQLDASDVNNVIKAAGGV